MKDTLKGQTLDNLTISTFGKRVLQQLWKSRLQKQRKVNRTHKDLHARKTKVNHSVPIRVTHPQAHTEENLQLSSYIKQVMN